LTAADYVIHLEPVVEPGRSSASDRSRAPHRSRATGDGVSLDHEGEHRNQIVELHLKKQRVAESLLDGGDRPRAASTPKNC